MRVFHRSVYAACAAAIVLGSSVATASAQEDGDGSGQAVFVQSNDPGANQVLAYHRASNGALTQVASYATGGQGGRLNGAAVDPLASQGSLVFDREHNLLIGVNAGSSTIYAFNVEGDRLARRQVVPSGGEFPVSIAIHGDLVYALNARAGGTVSGYRIDDDRALMPIADSTRALSLTPNLTSTEFLNTPGQAAFTPDGRHLVVTTKANGSHIDIFQVNEDGHLSVSPVINASQTPVPFAITFDAQRQLVVGEAAASNVSTYTVHGDGTTTPIATATDGQKALCWIARGHDAYFVANSGSGTVSSFHIDASGTPTAGQYTPVGAGPIDLSVTRDGRFLYVELGGAGSIAELRVNKDGSLTSIGTIAGASAEEGIVAL
jgi:6-phosphogluconolactonase (cycloisomerase 2 family)